MILSDAEKTFVVGQLVIAEKETFGLLETCFLEKSKYNTTIIFSDNIRIPKHSIGMIVGFIENWVVPAAVITFSDIKNGQRMIMTFNKINSLEDFIEKLDE